MTPRGVARARRGSAATAGDWVMVKERFVRLLDSFAGKRVLVVGDFILDEYLLGDTKRVSREAPVVVIDHKGSVFHPGGAANAVQNVTAMGGAALSYGLVGQDEHGATLARILDRRGADTSGLIATREIATAVKTRIVAGELHAQRQQVARIDRSYRVAASSPTLRDLGQRAVRGLAGADAVVVSDYGMGVVPGPVSGPLIEEARRRGVPVVVDSRFDLASYVGASVATPNEVELFDAMNVTRKEPPDLVAVARRAIRETRLDGLVVTRGNRGMLVCDAAGVVERIGIVGTSDVADVTGAGDTVSAVVALSLSSGASLVEAAEMATYAASIVVMKRGTATVSRAEMIGAREKHPEPLAPEAGSGDDRSS
jgi:rfaE bifunctional protein kinase chain/domain